MEITEETVRQALLDATAPLKIGELALKLMPQGTEITTEIRANIGHKLRGLRRCGRAMRMNPGERPALYWAD